MNVLFAGTPAFAVPSLETVARHHRVAAVLTNPDRPAGRGREPAASPVKSRALELGLPVLQPERLNGDFLRGVAALRPQLLVAVAFGRIFRREFLDLFPRGGINVHASLLPRFRGPSPITAAILAGEKETGVTVQRLALRMDAGDILAVDRVALDGTETTGSLSRELARRGADLLEAVLATLERGDPPGTPQREEEATYCRMVGKEDGRIDWGAKAERIERMIRAYDPWPRAWTLFRGQTLALLEGGVYPPEGEAGGRAESGAEMPLESAPAAVRTASEPRDSARQSPEGSARGPGRVDPGLVKPGLVLGVDKRYGILVQTGDGILYVRRLQLQAKRPMDWPAFLNGHRDFAGSLLGG